MRLIETRFGILIAGTEQIVVEPWKNKTPSTFGAQVRSRHWLVSPTRQGRLVRKNGKSRLQQPMALITMHGNDDGINAEVIHRALNEIYTSAIGVSILPTIPFLQVESKRHQYQI
jgi:hypothetical protein